MTNFKYPHCDKCGAPIVSAAKIAKRKAAAVRKQQAYRKRRQLALRGGPK